jgi:acyl-coenzyme A thioesterase PaaI-like protein
MSSPLPTAPPPGATLPERHPDAPEPGQPLGPHYLSCFGCGPEHPTGLHLQVVAGEGLTLRALFSVTEHHQGAPGLAHGGLLSTALDESLGALNWLTRTPAVTARLETDFRRPVPVGTTLHIDAAITGVHGRKIWTAAVGRVGDWDGPVAVNAAALFLAVGLEHFRQHGRPEDVAAAVAEASVRRTVRSFEVNP